MCARTPYPLKKMWHIKTWPDSEEEPSDTEAHWVRTCANCEAELHTPGWVRKKWKGDHWRYEQDESESETSDDMFGPSLVSLAFVIEKRKRERAFTNPPCSVCKKPTLHAPSCTEGLSRETWNEVWDP